MKRAILLIAVVVLTLSGADRLFGETPAPVGVRWTAGQIDQLTAPIALYPDPLLGAVLAASTYPLEVVEAARWLEDPAHAALKGEELASALETQRWDPSVKSLLPFPSVLHFMDGNLDWTEQLGDAFLAQQADVMDSVQRLRQRAAAQGTLRSTPQQTVATDQNAITIEPTSPDVIYVPYYLPAIYGPWPWPDYPPYDFAVPPDVILGDAFIGFGIGIGFGIFEPWWGWYGCNWPGHGVWLQPPPPHTPGHPRPHPPFAHGPGQPWQHDPQHRDGVPYRDAATASRYLGTGAAERRAFRGFPAQVAPTGAPAPTPAPAPGRETAPAPGPAPVPVPRPSYGRPAAPAPHAGPPAFESFGHGPQVRSEASRGSFSRSAPSSAPSGGGSHPGHR